MEVISNPGWIEVVTGPMFAGKSEELIRRIRRLEYAKKKIKVYKPAIDNRYTYGSSIRNDAYPTLWSQRLEPTLREYFRSMLPENEIDSNLKKARKIFCEN